MKTAIVLLLIVAVALVSAKKTTNSTCAKVHAVKGLNLTEWTRATWFIQEQQLTEYQKAEDLFCVTATYDQDDKSKVPFFSGTVRTVYNYANKGAVNGPAMGFVNSTAPNLCARVENDTKPSKLLVAPCFLPNNFAGDYWVMAYGTFEDPVSGSEQYTWGVVSGGQPTVAYDDGCTTKEDTTNGSGLWIFTRVPVAPQEWLDAAHGALKKLGYTLQRLLKVPQEGCHYTDDYIKH